MGANAMVSSIKGSTLKEAYAHACLDAGFENGNSYSGDINMSNGIYLAIPEAKLYHDAESEAQRLIDENRVHKWEACAAIRRAAVLNPRTINLEVVVTGLSYSDRRKAIENAVRSKLRPGEGIESIGTKNDEIKSKTVMSKQTPSVMEYQVMYWSRTISRHTSMTEARAAAINQFNAQKRVPGQIRQPLFVRGVKVRANEPIETHEWLFSIADEVTLTIATVEATVSKPGAALNEWLVAGVYSS